MLFFCQILEETPTKVALLSNYFDYNNAFF